MHSSSNSKGQWFLIAAVVVSGVFLAISGTFASYFGIDSSKVAANDESFIYKNIDEQFLATLEASKVSGVCGADVETNLNNFISFVKQKYGELGYYVEIKYDKADVSNCKIDTPNGYNIKVESGEMAIERKSQS